MLPSFEETFHTSTQQAGKELGQSSESQAVTDEDLGMSQQPEIKSDIDELVEEMKTEEQACVDTQKEDLEASGETKEDESKGLFSSPNDIINFEILDAN